MLLMYTYIRCKRYRNMLCISYMTIKVIILLLFLTNGNKKPHCTEGTQMYYSGIFNRMSHLPWIFLKELFTKTMMPYDLRNDYALDIPRYNTVTFTTMSRQETKRKFGEYCQKQWPYCWIQETFMSMKITFLLSLSISIYLIFSPLTLSCDQTIVFC